MGGNVVNFPRNRRHRSSAAFWCFYLLFTAAVGTAVIVSWLFDFLRAVLP